MTAPFLPLYVGDYLRDTRMLTAEQHGAYLLLLMSMWTAGGTLPNDDRKLARFATCSLSRWMKIRDDVMAFFEVRDEVVVQKRLKAELEKANEKSIRNRENGSAGGRAKSLKSKEPGVAIASPSPKQRARGLPLPLSEEEREEAAPPPDGGVALPLPTAPPVCPASTSNGGSELAGRGAAAAIDEAVKRAEAERVLADPGALAEDRFWALKYRVMDAGVNWTLVVKLARQPGGDFPTVVRAVERALGMRNPTSYLGKVLSEMRRDAQTDPPPAKAKSGRPAWVVEAHGDGLVVTADGPDRWVCQGTIYNDAGDEIGW